MITQGKNDLPIYLDNHKNDLWKLKLRIASANYNYLGITASFSFWNVPLSQRLPQYHAIKKIMESLFSKNNLKEQSVNFRIYGGSSMQLNAHTLLQRPVGSL